MTSQDNVTVFSTELIGKIPKYWVPVAVVLAEFPLLDAVGVETFQSDVYDSEENSLALSKANFANYILNEQAPFDKVSVEGFEDVFSVIENIVNT